MTFRLNKGTQRAYRTSNSQILLFGYECLLGQIIDLPNEILEKISSLILPDDIENSVLSYKTIHTLSKAPLALHLSRKKFTKTKICPTNISPEKQKPLINDIAQILRNLFEDPALAQYITDVHLDGRDFVAESWADNGESSSIIADSDTFFFQELEMQKSMYYEWIAETFENVPSHAQDDLVKRFIYQIGSINQGATIGQFLCMLSKLNRVSCKEYSVGDRDIQLENILDSAASSIIGGAKSPSIFENPTALEISSGTVKPFRHLCGLPSIRNFKCVSLELHIPPFLPRFLPPSPLESIELKDCIITLFWLQVWFGETQGLKKVHLDGCQGQFSSVLAMYPLGIELMLSSKTLECLEFVNLRGSVADWVNDSAGIGSLRSYTRLRVLELPRTVLR